MYRLNHIHYRPNDPDNVAITFQRRSIGIVIFLSFFNLEIDRYKMWTVIINIDLFHCAILHLEGRILADYIPPDQNMLPIAPHRIVFILFKRNQPWHTLSQPFQRHIFNTREFVVLNHLGPPVAAAFCYVLDLCLEANIAWEPVPRAHFCPYFYWVFSSQSLGLPRLCWYSSLFKPANSEKWSLCLNAGCPLPRLRRKLRRWRIQTDYSGTGNSG